MHYGKKFRSSSKPIRLLGALKAVVFSLTVFFKKLCSYRYVQRDETRGPSAQHPSVPLQELELAHSFCFSSGDQLDESLTREKSYAFLKNENRKQLVIETKTERHTYVVVELNVL